MTDATTSAGIEGRPRPEVKQVLEHLVGKQIVAVIGQKRLHTPARHQLATQRCRVKKLTIRLAMALHQPILADPPPKREHQPPIKSTVS